MKSAKMFTVAGCLSALLAGWNVQAVQARDLTVVSWGGNYQDAQRKIYFEPFSKKISKPVLEESWDGGIGVLAAKVKAGVPNWDVVQVEAEELALGCADGFYEKIDWSKVGGKDKFLPAAVDDCGVGAIVWSTALSYDANRLKEAPQSWADFWDTNKFPGKRGFRRGPKYAQEFALMADAFRRPMSTRSWERRRASIGPSRSSIRSSPTSSGGNPGRSLCNSSHPAKWS